MQETYLRAWRGYDRFEGRSSLRIWLYRIATNACLTALEHRSRRLLPSGWARRTADARAPAGPGRPGRPVAAAVARTPWSGGATTRRRSLAARGVRCAWLRSPALQHLPAKQRAVLILRDVMDWHAAEVAELLGTTVAA